MLKYDTLVKEMYERFPEIEEKSKKEDLEKYYDESMPHIAFGTVFVPELIKAIQNDEEKAYKYFGLLEEMEKSDDHLISEVSEFSVLEAIAGYISDDKIEKYLKTEELREAWHSIRMYIGYIDGE